MANIVEYILRLKDEVSGPLEDVEDQAEDTDRATADLAKGVAAMGVAFVAAGTAIVGITQQLADYKNGLVDTSTRTGVAVETLQGLQLAFEGSGQSAAAMEAFLQPLNKRLLDASRGVETAAQGFDALDVSVVDASGNLRSADEVLQETVHQLQGIEDPTLRASLAMDALGRGGAKVLQALGDTDIDVFVQHAQALGPAFRDGGAGAADFQRAMSDLELAGMGALDRIANAFDGENGVTGAIDAVTDGVVFMGVFVSEILGQVLDDVRASVDAIIGAVDALQAKDIQGAVSALGGFSFNPLNPVSFAGAFAAAEAGVAARSQVRRGRQATRSGAATGGLAGGGTTPRITGGASEPLDDLTGLQFKQLVDEFGIPLTNTIDPLEKLAEQTAAAAETTAELAEAQEARDAKLARGVDTAVGALGLLTQGFMAAASSFGSLVTGDVAGAAGGAITGAAGLVSGGLSLAAPAIGSAAGAAIGSVVLPGVGTVSGAAVGSAITALVPAIGDAIEGVAAGVADSISQIITVGQLGTAGVKEQLDTFQRDFLRGLEVLPRVVGEVLPEFAAEFGPALAEAAPVFAWEFTKALVSAAPELWGAFLDAQSAYVRTSVDESFGNALGLGEQGLSAGQGLLQTATQSIGAGVAGSTVINVSGVIAENVDRFVDEVSSRLGSRGLNLQLGAR